MARIRTIKPQFFDSESMASMSPRARLLFISLWTLADREGRLRYLPKRWVAHAFPHEDVDPSIVDELLTNKCLRMYDIDGRKYADLPGWSLHQRPPKNEAASRLPPFTEPPLPDDVHPTTTRPTKGGLGIGKLELGSGKLEPESTGSARARKWSMYDLRSHLGGRGLQPPAIQIPQWVGLLENNTDDELDETLKLCADKGHPLSYFLSLHDENGKRKPHAPKRQREATPANRKRPRGFARTPSS